MKKLRIAWLLPISFLCWQPSINQLTKKFPETIVFAAFWPGHAQGFENNIRVNIVGSNSSNRTYAKAVYDSNIDFLPLGIVKDLFNFNPDIVFANSFGIWTILALIFKFLGNWKVVIAYEGSSPGVDFLNSPFRLFVRRIMVWLADACITNGNAGKIYLTDVLKAKKDRVFCQPYEVPDVSCLLANSDKNEPLKIQQQQPVFLFIGQLVARKGIKFLLEACKLLQEQGYDKYTLLVVGNGVQNDELQAFAKSHNLEKNIEWIGRVEYSSLGTYLNCADVLVLPTLEDTWGVVVQEAMLFGKPVLCSKFAGSSQLIVTGENGYCFDPENIDKLASLMRTFINNPELAASMGEKSKQIIAKYTPESAAKFFSEVAYFAVDKKNYQKKLVVGG